MFKDSNSHADPGIPALSVQAGALARVNWCSGSSKPIRPMTKRIQAGKRPPYAFFGRTPKYRASTFVEHFRASEINPVRARKSRATPGGRGSQVTTGGE